MSKRRGHRVGDCSKSVGGSNSLKEEIREDEELYEWVSEGEDWGGEGEGEKWTEFEEFKSLIGEFLACPLCRKLMLEPYSTACRHNFCKDCIFEHLNDCPNCPTCTLPVIPADLSSNKTLMSINEVAAVHIARLRELSRAQEARARKRMKMAPMPALPRKASPSMRRSYSMAASARGEELCKELKLSGSSSLNLEQRDTLHSAIANETPEGLGAPERDSSRASALDIEIDTSQATTQGKEQDKGLDTQLVSILGTNDADSGSDDDDGDACNCGKTGKGSQSVNRECGKTKDSSLPSSPVIVLSQEDEENEENARSFLGGCPDSGGIDQSLVLSSTPTPDTCPELPPTSQGDYQKPVTPKRLFHRNRADSGPTFKSLFSRSRSHLPSIPLDVPETNPEVLALLDTEEEDTDAAIDAGSQVSTSIAACAEIRDLPSVSPPLEIDVDEIPTQSVTKSPHTGAKDEADSNAPAASPYPDVANRGAANHLLTNVYDKAIMQPLFLKTTAMKSGDGVPAITSSDASYPTKFRYVWTPPSQPERERGDSGSDSKAAYVTSPSLTERSTQGPYSLDTQKISDLARRSVDLEKLAAKELSLREASISKADDNVRQRQELNGPRVCSPLHGRPQGRSGAAGNVNFPPRKRLAATSVNAAQAVHLEKLLAKVGQVAIPENFLGPDNTDILVIGRTEATTYRGLQENGRRRHRAEEVSMSLLAAIAAGLWIVDFEWVTDTLTGAVSLEPSTEELENYEIIGVVGAAKAHNVMRSSRLKHIKNLPKIFSSMNFAMAYNQESPISLKKVAELSHIAHLGGANVLNWPPKVKSCSGGASLSDGAGLEYVDDPFEELSGRENASKKVAVDCIIVISSDETDRLAAAREARRILSTDYPGAKMVSQEWMLDSILNGRAQALDSPSYTCAGESMMKSEVKQGAYTPSPDSKASHALKCSGLDTVESSADIASPAPTTGYSGSKRTRFSYSSVAVENSNPRGNRDSAANEVEVVEPPPTMDSMLSEFGIDDSEDTDYAYSNLMENKLISYLKEKGYLSASGKKGQEDAGRCLFALLWEGVAKSQKRTTVRKMEEFGYPIDLIKEFLKENAGVGEKNPAVYERLKQLESRKNKKWISS